MATVDLSHLVRVEAVPVAKGSCADCNWRAGTRKDDFTPSDVDRAAKVHAAAHPGHKVTVDAHLQHAYAMP